MRTIILAFLIGAVGCGTAYPPRPSREIRVLRVGSGGMGRGWVLAKDGQEIEAGMLAGGLVDATQDVPAAQEEAQTARSRYITSLITAVIGGGALGVGIGLSQWGTGLETTRNKAALGLILGSLPFIGLTIGLESDGHLHVLNAVNIYNDTLRGSANPVPIH